MTEMTAEETNKKEDKTKSEGSGPMGSGMLDVIKKCCSGEGAFSDCSTMMKGMMETMRGHPCCSPGTGDTESERREK
jgi:hypothetical protein